MRAALQAAEAAWQAEKQRMHAATCADAVVSTRGVKESLTHVRAPGGRVSQKSPTSAVGSYACFYCDLIVHRPPSIDCSERVVADCGCEVWVVVTTCKRWMSRYIWGLTPILRALFRVTLYDLVAGSERIVA